MCELGLARAGLNVASYVHVVKRNLECYSGYIQASWPDTVTVDASQSVGAQPTVLPGSLVLDPGTKLLT